MKNEIYIRQDKTWFIVTNLSELVFSGKSISQSSIDRIDSMLVKIYCGSYPAKIFINYSRGFFTIQKYDR